MKDIEKIENNLSTEKSQEQLIDREDNDLIQLVLNGSVNAYGLLIEKYQKAVYNLFLRMLHDQEEARELTQLAFIKAYEALSGFRSGCRFFSWLYRIAINLALNELKKKKNFVSLEKIYNLADEKTEENTDQELLLKKAIDKLKEKYRLVVILKYYQQLSYKEIADTLEIPEKKVRSRLFDARLQLKQNLQQTEYFRSYAN